MIGVVFGMLQSKTWGWIVPLHSPEINGVELTPLLGISYSAWFITVGLVLLVLFFRRQRKLVEAGREPLVHVDLLSIVRLRSGLTVLGAQYAITAGLFFMMPVYLQMTLGLDALETGIRIFPLSVSLILFSAVGTRLSARWSPRRIVLIAQWILVASSVLLLGAVDPRAVGMDLRHRHVHGRLGARAARLAARERQHVGRHREGHERGRRPAGRLPEPRIVARHRADRLDPDRRPRDVVRLRGGDERAARRGPEPS